MYKYTVKAYNDDRLVGAVDVVNIIVQASSEEEAIKRATAISQRNTHKIISIEDLHDDKFNKLQVGPSAIYEVPPQPEPKQHKSFFKRNKN